MLDVKDQQDCPRWTKDYQRLTQTDHHIECIRAFGHCNRKENDPPLEEHIHLNCLEVTVMLKGNQVYQVGEREYKLWGNQIFITLPNVPHSSGDVPQLQAEYYYFQLNPMDYKKILGLDTRNTKHLIEQLMRIQGHLFPSDKVMSSLIASAFCHLATQDETRRRCAQAQIVSFLYMLCNTARNTFQHDFTLFITLVNQYIEEHIHEDIQLEDLAQEFGYSLSYFKYKFREEAGITPMYYINRQKIDLAKKYLAQGNSVTETAMALSFNSSNYFSTLFHRFTSMTPTMYQNNLRKK